MFAFSYYFDDAKANYLLTSCVLKLRFERFGMHALYNIYVLEFMELRFGRLSMIVRS